MKIEWLVIAGLKFKIDSVDRRMNTFIIKATRRGESKSVTGKVELHNADGDNVLAWVADSWAAQSVVTLPAARPYDTLTITYDLILPSKWQEDIEDELAKAGRI